MFYWGPDCGLDEAKCYMYPKKCKKWYFTYGSEQYCSSYSWDTSWAFARHPLLTRNGRRLWCELRCDLFLLNESLINSLISSTILILIPFAKSISNTNYIQVHWHYHRFELPQAEETCTHPLLEFATISEIYGQLLCYLSRNLVERVAQSAPSTCKYHNARGCGLWQCAGPTYIGARRRWRTCEAILREI